MLVKSQFNWQLPDQSMRRLFSIIAVLVFFCAAIPPELASLCAQDQNMEIEQSTTEAEIDDAADTDIKFFMPTMGASPDQIVLFAKTNHASLSSLFFEEVPTPPPLAP